MKGQHSRPRIRLRYSGLVNFSARIYSAFTGLVFTTLITRNLLPQEVGLWRLINALLVYFLLPSRIFNDWITRYRARGIVSASITGTLNGLFLAVSSSFVFLILSPSVIPELRHVPPLMLVSMLSIPILTMNYVTSSSLQAIAPHMLGYGEYLFETLKVLLLYALVLSLRSCDLLIAFSSVLIAFIARISFFLILLRKELSSTKFDKEVLKAWYLMSWVQLYSLLPGYIYTLDNFLVNSLALDPKVTLGLIQVLMSVGGIAAYVTRLSEVLYSKVLSSSEIHEVAKSVEVMLKLTLMLNMPLIFGALVLSKEVLSVFGEAYISVSPLLPLMMLFSTISAISSLLGASLRGLESADMESPSFRRLLKSKLTLIPTLDILGAVLYLSLLAPYLLIVKMDPFHLIMWMIVLRTLSSLLVSSVKAHLLKGAIMGLRMLRPLLNYISSSILMVLAILLVKTFFTSDETLGKSLRTREAILLIFPYLLIGLITYCLALYALDAEFRQLVRISFNELKDMLTRVKS